MPRTLPLLEDTGPVCCPPLGAAADPLSYDDAVQVARRLKALADPVRIQLVSALLASPGREACTCDLAPVVSLSEPTVSHHLKQLLEAGMVSKERRGMNVYYRVQPDAVQAMGRLLVDCC